MSRHSAQLTLEAQCALVRETACANRLGVESIALSRAHGRVLAEEPAHAPGDVPHDAGRFLIPATRLTPARIALAASRGHGQLKVARKPTVAVLTVSEGAIEPGLSPVANRLFGGARDLLVGLLRDDGLEPTCWPTLSEDERQIEIAVRDTACAFDMVLVCADMGPGYGLAASVIDRFGSVAFGSRGVDCDVPVVFASLDQAFVMLLRAEPAQLAGAYMTLVRSLSDGLQGIETARRQPRARLTGDLAFGTDARFAPVELAYTEAAVLEATPIDGTGFPALATCRALAVAPVRGALLRAGAVVDLLALNDPGLAE